MIHKKKYIDVEKEATVDASDTKMIFAAVTKKEAMRHVACEVDHAA